TSVRSIWELFKEVQPDLRDLILKLIDLTENTSGASDAVGLLLDIMGGIVDGSKAFIDAAGGMEGALWTLLPAITAVTLAMIGMVGLPAAIAAACIAAIPTLIYFGQQIGDNLAKADMSALESELGFAGTN